MPSISAGIRHSAALRFLCVVCCFSASSAFAQGVEFRTSNTATDVSRLKVETSSGVGVDANAYFQNAKVGIGTATPEALLTIGSSTSGDVTLKMYSEADAGLFLIADSDNGAGEEDQNAYILLQQDGATSDAFVGLCPNGGNLDPQNNAYTGTLTNYLLIGSTAVGDGVQIGTAGSVRMTVATGGFVGIGTTAPAHPLDVNGTARAQGLLGLMLPGANTTNATFGAWPGNAANTWLYLSNGDTIAPAYSDLAVGDHWTAGAHYLANSDIYFNKTNHNHSGIGNTAGYAAIENASDYSALMLLGRSGGLGGVRSVSVWDRFDMNGLFVCWGNGTTTSAIIEDVNNSYWADWAAGWDGALATWDVCCSGVRHSILQARSDRRLKKNIEPLGDALLRLQGLRPVSFEWKDPRVEAGRHFGFIAQEVEEVIPELVRGSGDETRSLALEQLTPFLVKGTQELTAALREERRERQAMEARLEALEREILTPASAPDDSPPRHQDPKDTRK